MNIQELGSLGEFGIELAIVVIIAGTRPLFFRKSTVSKAANTKVRIS